MALAPDDPARVGANERLVLAAAHGRTAVSRAELAAATGLPKTTVAGVVARLLRRGLLAEEPGEPAAEPGRRGRRAGWLSPTPPPGRVGVVTFAHTGVRAAVAGLDGTMLARRAAALAGPASEAEIVDRGADLLTEALAEAGLAAADLRGVVLGVPAPIEPGVGLVAGPDPELLRPGGLGAGISRFRADPSIAVAARLGVPAVAENDANLGALGEAAFGAGRGLASFLYVKVADGLGAGIVLDGRLHRGVRGLAGELAHVQVTDEGPWCPCGGRGCLVHTFGTSATSYVEAAYPRPVHFAEILGLASAGEAGSRRILADAGRRLGRVLAATCTMLCPEAVIVDGGFGAASVSFLAGVREMIERHTSPAVAMAVRILDGETGPDAEFLGGVALARAEGTGEAPW